jgi:cysteine synthase B
MTLQYPTIADCVGNTPLVRLQRIAGETSNTLAQARREQPGGFGQGPSGAVDDHSRRTARADQAGDTLIEATSGNTGIALAMAAAIKGYKMILIMPDNSSAERKAAMTAYGAELILVTQEEGMEGARDLAEKLQAEGRGLVLDQFANGDNPIAHYTTTGPEIWRADPGHHHPFRQLHGHHRHHHGLLALPQGAEPRVQIIGLQPMEGSAIPGIRRWPEEYLPKIFDAARGPHRRHGAAAKPKTPPVAWPAKKAFSAACPPAVRWRPCCACPAKWKTR